MTSTGAKTSSISVIIPTLNEEVALHGLITSLQPYSDLEIIVADGGSVDGTLACAQRHDVRVVNASPGRGHQLRSGAELASREVVLFLHVDTVLPDDFAAHIEGVLRLPDTAAGAFLLRIGGEGVGYRIVEWGANLRSRLFGLPYGDQAIFVRNAILRQAGGVPQQPILEDLALIRRLKRSGKIRIASARVTTSARRWQRLGLFRTVVHNQMVLLGALCGVPEQTLHRFYTGRR